MIPILAFGVRHRREARRRRDQKQTSSIPASSRPDVVATFSSARHVPVQVKWAAMATQVVRRDLQCTRHGDAELLVRLSIHAAHMVRCGEQLKRSSQPTRRLDHWTIEAKLQSCLDVMPAIAAASDQNQESPPPSTPPRGLQFADLMTFKLEPCA